MPNNAIYRIKTPQAIIFIGIMLLISFILIITIGQKHHYEEAQQAYQKSNNAYALELVEKELKQNPNNSDAIHLKAKILVALKRVNEAIDLYEKLVSSNQSDATILYELANLYQEHNYLQKSSRLYIKLIQLGKITSSVLCNLAYALSRLGLRKEAIPYYEKVVNSYPNHARAHYGLAELYLSLGDFKRGWKEFEWRQKNSRDTRDFNVSRWSGSDPGGKTILLRCEYGLGDTIHFIRYAKILKEHGATIIVEAQKPLIPLLSQCNYIDKIIPVFDKLPPFDIQSRLMSLAYIESTTEQTIPHEIPYISADPVLVKHWKSKLYDDNNFKVGICWTGNSFYDQSLPPFSRRALHPSLLKPITIVEGISIYSLQTPDINKKVPNNLSIKVFDETFDVTNGPFMDTAALITNLDLVITIDTVIAHLAGALGKTVWVILPYVADWRWMIKQADSPWYPTMQLFRQQKPGDWQEVIQIISKKLTYLINKEKKETG